ncbi:hypothetical protein V6N12_065024 [Hibiscus sabdariffa]|uniref:Retrotransposon gag domain-containing protein n=1 Tax=Hibiscus sabdariffa TaxID=183260 RepID=A0ABR2G817_9ROSI
MFPSPPSTATLSIHDGFPSPPLFGTPLLHIPKNYNITVMITFLADVCRFPKCISSTYHLSIIPNTPFYHRIHFHLPHPTPPLFQINSGKHIFTLDDIPSTRWPQRFQEFHAWMDTQKLTRESNYEILTEFVSRFTGTLRDWWNSLSQQDQVAFLTRQNFSKIMQILHTFFLGNQEDMKTLKRKEFFKRRCCSSEKTDLQRHFTVMTKLFYFLGADPNLKHTILASIPEVLQNAVTRHLQNSGRRVENLTIGEIQQETYMALEEICDRRKIIKDYLSGSKEIDRACKDTRLQIKCKKEEGCRCKQREKHPRKGPERRPFRTPAYPKSLRRKRK